jgi:hypothetical protein
MARRLRAAAGRLAARIGFIAGVLRSRVGAPDKSEILELGLDAFDLELD